MFDFINRAASIKQPAVVEGLNQLIPHGDWRATLGAAEAEKSSGLSSEERKSILVEAFASNLAHFGDYEYVVETTVLRSVKVHIHDTGHYEYFCSLHPHMRPEPSWSRRRGLALPHDAGSSAQSERSLSLKAGG